MFSGPDFLYAHQFFPNARTYILAGTEPIGPLPDVLRFAGPALEPVLQNLQKSLNSVLSFSFFITKDMKTDLATRRTQGHAPDLLRLSRARRQNHHRHHFHHPRQRAGNRTPPRLTRKAKVSRPGSASLSPARPIRRPQTLYYFTTDLSNEGIRQQPGFMKFCAEPGHGLQPAQVAPHI